MREVTVERYITTVVRQTVIVDLPDHVLVDDYFDPFEYGAMEINNETIENVLDTTGWREQQKRIVFSPVQVLPPGTVDRDYEPDDLDIGLAWSQTVDDIVKGSENDPRRPGSRQ